MPKLLNLSTLRRPLAVWLALLLAVVGALLPTLSLATMGGRGVSPAMIEVCSSSGSHWRALDASPDSQNGPASTALSEHCAFCLHQADRVLPPPRVFFQGFGTVGEPVAPAIGQAFLCITLPVRVPPPRGPPEWV